LNTDYLRIYLGGDLYFKVLDYASGIGGILAVGLYFCEVIIDLRKGVNK
jgi:hypothetical protein